MLNLRSKLRTNWNLRNNIVTNWKRNLKTKPKIRKILRKLSLTRNKNLRRLSMTRSQNLSKLLKLRRKTKKLSRCASWSKLTASRRWSLSSRLKSHKWSCNSRLRSHRWSRNSLMRRHRWNNSSRLRNNRWKPLSRLRNNRWSRSSMRRSIKLRSNLRMRRWSCKRPMRSSKRRRKPECRLRRITKMSSRQRSLPRLSWAKRWRRRNRFRLPSRKRLKSMRLPSMPLRKSYQLTKRSKSKWSMRTWSRNRLRMTSRSSLRMRRKRPLTSRKLTRRRVRPKLRSLRCQSQMPFQRQLLTVALLTSSSRTSLTASNKSSQHHKPRTCQSIWRSFPKTDRCSKWSKWAILTTSQLPTSKPWSCHQLRFQSQSKVPRTRSEFDWTKKSSKPSRSEQF